MFNRKKFLISSLAFLSAAVMVCTPAAAARKTAAWQVDYEEAAGENLSVDPVMKEKTGDTGISSQKISETDIKKLKETGESDWLQDTPEITEEEAFDLLAEKDITAATLNRSSNNLYLVFQEDREIRCIKNVSGNFVRYLQLKGVAINTVSFKEGAEAVATKQAESRVNDGIFLAGFAVFAFIICMAIHARRERTMVPERGAVDRKTKTKERTAPDVRLSDVECVEGLKADIMGIVDFLKDPQKYRDIGARVPNGIILYGPPGTGKTMLAKAVAGEADIPFISAAGSDFIEQYVGIGAKRVRALYAEAKKKAPCIVFIDEVDAVAGKRGRGENSERDQTVNALLTELDGFDSSRAVVTICATNRLDMLDDAFQRSGRFDLKLAVGLPDRDARYRILQKHSKNKKLSDEVDLMALAGKTRSLSGADLEAILNESALEAVRRGSTVIGNEDIDSAFFKIVMKGNKKKRDCITETNRIVAWHEAGHTLAAKFLTEDSVPSVTIIGSASGAGGVTFRAQKEETALYNRKYLERSVMVMYAGRAAEELYFGNGDDITTGASQDIKQATGIIRQYLAVFGMGEMGMLDATQFKGSDAALMKEASRMAKQLYQKTVEFLEDNRQLLQDLAEELLEKETLDEEQIDRILACA